MTKHKIQARQMINDHIENTKPDLKKVRAKILNTAKCAAEQPKNVYPLNNLERLKLKYPQVAKNLADQLAKIAEAA